MSELEIMLAEMTLAIRDGKGFEIKVIAPGFEQPETISNPAGNVKAKREYYTQAYNEDLELKTNPKIKIVSYRSWSEGIAGINTRKGGLLPAA